MLYSETVLTFWISLVYSLLATTTLSQNDEEILPGKIIVEEIIPRTICYVTTFEFLLRQAANKEGLHTGANIQYLERISNTKTLDLNEEFDVGKIHVSTFLSKDVLK